MGQGSLSAWTESILFIIAFIAITAVIVVNFNYLYDKDYQIGLGANTTVGDKFINYQETASGAIEGGEADFTSLNGLTLKSSWEMSKTVFSIVGGFITGGFIEDSFRTMGLGESGLILAKWLRVLFFISLVFAILYILFKVIA